MGEPANGWSGHGIRDFQIKKTTNPGTLSSDAGISDAGISLAEGVKKQVNSLNWRIDFLQFPFQRFWFSQQCYGCRAPTIPLACPDARAMSPVCRSRSVA